MAVHPLILLPPSEGKAPGGDGPPWEPDTMANPALDTSRGRVLRAMGRTYPPRTAPTAPAIERYTGVLYKELGAASLRLPARRRLDRSVLVVSGLWGLVAPTDPIPEYKLKMSASAPRLGKLSTWWRPQLTKALATRADGAIVWDLLPIEHCAAWTPSAVPYERRITVQFLDRDGKTVSHWNKLLKGSLVRWLVTTGHVAPEALADFDHPQGYRFDPAGSDLDSDPAVVVFRQG